MIADKRKLKNVKVFDLFEKPDGSRIETPQEWMECRDEWKTILKECLYGTFPEAAERAVGTVAARRLLYGGKAVWEKIILSFGKEEKIELPAEIIRPVKEGAAPVILWNRHNADDICPAEEELVCSRGFAIASFCRGDLIEDAPGMEDHRLLRAYPHYSWGRIAQWAFGLMRLLDYVEQQPYCDRSHVVASGHSRGGKVAICAAIYDERFTMCHANGSGCFGAGSLRIFGGHFGYGHGNCETVTKMNESFSYWWGPALSGYTGENEWKMPADGHLLRALIAPRPVITTEGWGDDWSNPYGTQIMWRAAQEVYEFLGCREKNAIHYREGGHQFQTIDWEALADFMEMQFFGRTPETNVVSFRAIRGMEGAFDWRQEQPFYEWRCPSHLL